jgi:acyl-CoA reductase-like NAD-dependent aldehyde dehydrogenase
MTAEHGKPFFQSKAEIAYAGSFIEWFAETANRNYGDTIPSELSLPDVGVVNWPAVRRSW